MSPIIVVPPVLADFRVGTVRLEGGEFVVAIADTPVLRPQGLMNVTNLLSLDGMVFFWPEDTETRFWMKDTLISLDIAWFDSSGLFISMLTMPPCGDEEHCPKYFAAGPYRSALEMPEGAMPDLREGSRLEFLEGS